MKKSAIIQKKGVNLPCNKSIRDMNIKIKVINQLTNEVEIDSQIDVTSTYEVIKNNHEVFRRAFPDCQVNFTMDDNNFIYSPAYNMDLDEIAYEEGRMTWNDYISKWYKGSTLLSNEDQMLDQEIEYMVDALAKEEFDRYDSICH